MKQRFYLPGLNFPKKEQAEQEGDFARYFSQNLMEFPVLSLFVTDTNVFFREKFSEFNKYKLREKRLLEFETPNRAKITHEYDIDLDMRSEFNPQRLYYLFNPASRLSWLKIERKGERIVVANETQVKKVVRSLPDFAGELKKLHSGYKKDHPDGREKEDDIFEELWKLKLGLPCFISMDKSEEKRFILKVEYWDSIQLKYSSRRWFKSFFCPIEEREIEYEYFPLENASSWLYLRAPEHFEIEVTQSSSTSVNKIDISGADSDPEIKSLTIINSGVPMQTDDYVVTFNIEIKVPLTLKLWYNVIYLTTMSLIVLLLLGFGNRFLLQAGISMYDKNIIDDLIFAKDFNNIILAVVATIIATRGWLIVEETILKRYSSYLTRMMILLVVLTIVYSLL